MKLFVVLLGTSLGTGISIYAIFSVITPAMSALISQGTVPDLSLKDWTSLGGFATFATYMSWLYIRSVDRHERQIKEEIERHEKQNERKDNIIFKMIDKGYSFPTKDE